MKSVAPGIRSNPIKIISAVKFDFTSKSCIHAETSATFEVSL